MNRLTTTKSFRMTCQPHCLTCARMTCQPHCFTSHSSASLNLILQKIIRVPIRARNFFVGDRGNSKLGLPSLENEDIATWAYKTDDLRLDCMWLHPSCKILSLAARSRTLMSLRYGRAFRTVCHDTEMISRNLDRPSNISTAFSQIAA